MVDPKAYHFHSDCIYYEQSTIEEVVHDGHKCIKFKCPMMKYPTLYYKNDFSTIKWECRKFEPIQNSLFDEVTK